MENYVMTHCHTTYSIGDSTTQPEDLIAKAKEYGMKAICITEHGNCFNWIKKKQLCDKAGIKFIFGIEIYLTKDLKTLVKDNYHSILIAKNLDGVHEINKLIDVMNRDDGHMYCRPRLTFDEFCKISNNVITTSACLGSPLRVLEEEDGWFERLMDRYDYLEIQPHVVKKQIDYNNKIIYYSQKYGKELISGTDTHEIDEYHKECRLIYMIGRAKANGEEYYDDAKDFDLSFKTLNEVIEMYKKQNIDEYAYMQALENTNIVADMVEDFKLDTSYKYPTMYKAPFDDLRKCCYERLNLLIANNIISEDDCDKYIDRLEYEMSVFEKLDMGSFMNYKHNHSLECWQNGVPIGPGRGSVTGSLVAYLSQITDVDPMVWGTNFARFCNINRYSLGDIDTDYSPDQRQFAYDLIQRDFTKENSAYIITFQKMKIKSIIDYVCRAIDLSKEEMVNIKIGYDELEKEQQALDKQFGAERISEDEYNEKTADIENRIDKYISQFDNIFYYYKGINGSINAIGKHACGICGSPIPLSENIGTFYNKKSKSILVQCDMKCIDSVNYVKYDILGLKTLQVLRETYEMIGKKYPQAHEINWNDTDVFENIGTSPVGLFQFEAENSFSRLKQFQPYTVQDIAFVTAIIRPSCASFIDTAIKKELHKNPTEEIDEILSGTYGYLIYQEQIIAFLQKACGFTEGEADVIRRAIGKKSKELLDEWIPKITEGYIKNSGKEKSIAEKEFNEFLVILMNASNYSFSYNHAIAYSMITYMCAYARYYYPVEFICSYLNNATNDSDIEEGTKLATQYGIEIRNAKFGMSSGRYSVKNGVIYKGIGSILNVSEELGNLLYKKYDSLENKNLTIVELFDTISDIRHDNDSNNISNSKNISTLIRIDYFSNYGKAKMLEKAYDIYKRYINAKIIKKDNIQMSKICRKLTQDGYEGFSETKAQFKVDGRKLVEFIISKLPNEDYTDIERMQHQLSYLNYIQDKDLLSKYNIYYVKYKSKKNGILGLVECGSNKLSWHHNGTDKNIEPDDYIVVYIESSKRNGRRKELYINEFDLLTLDRRKEKKQ